MLKWFGYVKRMNKIRLTKTISKPGVYKFIGLTLDELITYWGLHANYVLTCIIEMERLSWRLLRLYEIYKTHWVVGCSHTNKRS